MGMSPITVRLLGATIAASLGGIGAHWGAFASLAAIAVVAIAALVFMGTTISALLSTIGATL